MQIAHDLAALRKALAALRREAGATVALVPTMGALHHGHMALVAEAKSRADHVVVSIFVNAPQFNQAQDFASYPRRDAKDQAMLAAAGCTLIWAPDAQVMYPPGFQTQVRVRSVAEGLCGAARPGHFEGVATVVAKLLNQVDPDIALFGEKDFQQLAVIRVMVRDLDMRARIVGVPIVRDADGLALSSRNMHLGEDQRRAARTLPRALGEAATAIKAGADVAASLAAVRASLMSAGFASVDYAELRAETDLAPLERLDRPARLLAAATIGSTRLIDNLALAPD